MTREPTAARARGKWRGILIQLGVSPKVLDGKHQPCPFCGGDNRFRFDDKGGSGSFFCNGSCGAGQGIKFVMLLRGCDFKTAAREIDSIVGGVDAAPIKPARDPDKVRRSLNRLWRASRPITPDDAAGRWLMQRCGVSEPGLSLRFHPDLPYMDGETAVSSWPCMVAKIVGPDGKPSSLHRTYLLPDGSDKAPVKEPRRTMPGAIADGAAVPLMPVVGDTLGIGEGIETSFAAGRKFGIPVWAALNRVLLQKFVPPPDVRLLVIFADADRNYAGQADAYSLAVRLRCQPHPIDVEVAIPPRLGTDWRDVWADEQPRVPEPA